MTLDHLLSPVTLADCRKHLDIKYDRESNPSLLAKLKIAVDVVSVISGKQINGMPLADLEDQERDRILRCVELLYHDDSLSPVQIGKDLKNWSKPDDGKSDSVDRKRSKTRKKAAGSHSTDSPKSHHLGDAKRVTADPGRGEEQGAEEKPSTGTRDKAAGRDEVEGQSDTVHRRQG